MIDQLKSIQSEQLANDVADFIENGGTIHKVPNTVHGNFSTYFGKSKTEMAILAKKEKRTYFSFFCQKHGIVKHRTKDMQCIRCMKVKSMQDLADKYCSGVEK